MSPAVLTLISWAPFLIFILIFGIVFSLKGYKRGAARAGISIGVTVLSTLLSILVARLVAAGVASGFSPMLANALESAGVKVGANELSALATGLASALASLLFFIPIFIILVSVMKPVASFITKKYIKDAKHVGNKIGGLSISIVDAFLLSMLLTLPLYGTLSLVDDVFEVVPSKQNEATEMVSAVTDPFVVDLAGLPPFSTAYDTLMSCEIGGTTVSVSGTIRDVTDIVREAKIVSKLKADSFNKKPVISLLNSAEKILTKNKLISDFACDFIGKKLPAVKLPGLGKIELKEMYPALGDGSQLRSDLPEFFNLGRAVVNSGMLEALVNKSTDVSKVDAAMISNAFGSTLNHSSSLATFKSNLLKTVSDSFAKKIIEDGKDENGAVQALCDAIAAIPTEPLSKKEAAKEGEAFYLIMTGVISSSDEKNVGAGVGMMLEGLARHPMIGPDTVIDAAGAIMKNANFDVSDSLLVKLKENLLSSLEKPIGDATFGKYCGAAFNTIDAFSGIMKDEASEDDKKSSNESLKNLILSDKGSLGAVKDTVSSDLMEDMGIGSNHSDAFKEIADATFDAIIGSNCTEEEAEKEAEALGSVLETITNVTQNPEESTSIIKEYTVEIVNECLDSKIVTEMIIDLTKNGRTDPFGLFKGMPESDMAEIEDTIDRYIESAESAEKIAALEAYKLFVGIKSNG